MGPLDSTLQIALALPTVQPKGYALLPLRYHFRFIRVIHTIDLWGFEIKPDDISFKQISNFRVGIKLRVSFFTAYLNEGNEDKPS